MYRIKMNPNRSSTLVLLLLCVFWSGVCFGQSTDANVRLQTKVTYSCENLPMEVVLKELAHQAGVFIVKSPLVTGEVTIEVKDIPLEELLTNVLGAYNYTYIATKNMIRVVPLSEAVVLRETLITQIYKITYADAGEVSSALADFLSLNGKVSFNKGTSHIIVTDTEDKIKAIGKFIEEIDKATPQVLVEVRIYDITSNEKFEIETKWNIQSNESKVTREHRSVTTSRSGFDTEALIPHLEDLFPTETINTTSYDGYETTIDNSDVTTSSSAYTDTHLEEVNEEGESSYIIDHSTAALDEIGSEESSSKSDETDTEDFGAQSSTVTGADSTETRTGTKTDTETSGLKGFDLDDYLAENRNNTVSRSVDTKRYKTERRKPVIGGSFDKKRGGTIRISLLNNAIDLDFALSMLHSTVEAKLLASPRVMVLDNETATFETVREVPYTERTTSGGEVLTSTQFKSVGVMLEVTPHIARDNMVRLKVKPEFGVVVDINEDGAPTIETRRTETTTLIRSGQTIVLAGLRKKEIKKGIDKMPFFGDLPLLGGLFRTESEKEVTSELVVFITTRIITEPTLTEEESKQYNATNFRPAKVSESKWLESERRRSKAAIARDLAKKASARAKAEAKAAAKAKTAAQRAAAAAQRAKAGAAAKAQTVNASNYDAAQKAAAATRKPKAVTKTRTAYDIDHYSKMISAVKAQNETLEPKAPQHEKRLEPIEATPVNSADFIRQWMRRTQKQN